MQILSVGEEIDFCHSGRDMLTGLSRAPPPKSQRYRVIGLGLQQRLAGSMEEPQFLFMKSIITGWSIGVEAMLTLIQCFGGTYSQWPLPHDLSRRRVHRR